MNSRAVVMAARPMGPAPTTTTLSPGRIRPLSTPTSYEVGRMSASMSAASSLAPSGSSWVEVSANGTRTYSAWVPSMRWPRIQPPRPRRCPYVTVRQ
ncbi:hypothetical protein SMD20_16885 [Nonomuraea sp. LP-02]|uniref:hypothetical protein n=1 Tax=Nonomuraea sp. LP-02 TaxID=3097960 RepID=UPI002E37A6DF|nr:hypothetical protein [Nonomuraea sp. LP-02]MED7925932.1 hypothetical protein [Nonomuraea sp. LP-02]